MKSFFSNIGYAAQLLGLMTLVSWTSVAHAYQEPPPAYLQAAREAGVPSVVLFAVAVQESGVVIKGRKLPWPWTLNVAGQTLRFRSRDDACLGLLRAARQVSAKRIDVGLGQINLGYHANRYARPCDLLDPYRNLAIAASILKEQHTGGEDWLATIGRYHRPAGGEAAVNYSHSVRRHAIQMMTSDSAR